MKGCECDEYGSYDSNCNKETGQCNCKPGYTGIKCDQCDVGYFGSRICETCDCDGGVTADICHRNNGSCICKPNYGGRRCDECAPGYYNYPLCLRKFIDELI